MEAKIIQDSTCPITLDLFEDPVTVPCCGKAVSRIPLRDYLSNNSKCPLCKGDLSNFNAATASTNKNLLSFVELIKQQQAIKQSLERADKEREEQKLQQQQQWSLTINKIYGDMVFVCSCGKKFQSIENRQSHIRDALAANPTEKHEPAGQYKISRKQRQNESEPYIPIAEFRLNLKNSTFRLKESLFIMVVDKSGLLIHIYCISFHLTTSKNIKGPCGVAHGRKFKPH